MAAFGSAAVASYACFCWSLAAYSSWIVLRRARVPLMAWVAAASAV
ncbi:hypothetical protein [Micromonospora globbae]|nr:hypothetical protein [Micromonospora globbae]